MTTSSAGSAELTAFASQTSDARPIQLLLLLAESDYLTSGQIGKGLDLDPAQVRTALYQIPPGVVVRRALRKIGGATEQRLRAADPQARFAYALTPLGQRLAARQGEFVRSVEQLYASHQRHILEIARTAA